MNAVIDVHEVTKRFRRTVAVDGLTLSVPEGAVTAFLDATKPAPAAAVAKPKPGRAPLPPARPPPGN